MGGAADVTVGEYQGLLARYLSGMGECMDVRQFFPVVYGSPPFMVTTQLYIFSIFYNYLSFNFSCGLPLLPGSPNLIYVFHDVPQVRLSIGLISPDFMRMR